MSLEEYQGHILQGEKWCATCKAWHVRSDFGRDSASYDGLTVSCLQSRAERGRRLYVKKGLPEHSGPLPSSPRHGDKSQARHRVRHLVETGKLPDPNFLPCTDCGHIYDEKKRHEYDHYMGYEAAHHLTVQAVCTTCHHAREIARGTHGSRRKKHGSQPN